ncbi:MAG: uroporphyrinogen decarboxylase family protein [bacterium]
MKVKMRETIGTDNYEDYFRIEIRRVGFKPVKKLPDFSSYYGKSLPKNTYFDDWGIPYVTGSEGHVKRELYPMAAFKTKDEIFQYPWPDFMSLYRHEDLEEEVKKLHDQGYAVIGRLTEVSGGFIFETAWQLRGMGNLLVDFYDNPIFARALLDKITEINVEVSIRFAEAGVDILWLADDIGMQDTMLMSPAMWRKWLRPRLKNVIDSAKRVNPCIRIFYHSDGFIEPVIPELIEIGVDVLNPIQPECMNPVKLKRLYGDRLSFFGTIGVQTVMPFGSPEEVRHNVGDMIEKVGQGGGFIIAPTHFVSVQVPWENVEAFFDAVEEFGQY